MKKRLPITIIAAALALTLIGCAAFAAANFEGIIQFFKSPGHGDEAPNVNEDIQEFIKPLDISYDGNSAKVEVREILYDEITSSIALSWTIESKYPGEALYVICNPYSSKGYTQRAHMDTVTDYMLTDYAESIFSAALPEGAEDVILPFEIIRLNAEAQRVSANDFETEEAFETHLKTLLENGILPVAGDGSFELYWLDGKTSAEKLLSTGLCELLDSFTITLPIDASISVSKARTLSGENTFALEEGEIIIHTLTASPVGVYIEMDYISNTPFSAETGTPIYIDLNPPKLEYWCSGVSSEMKDPVLLPDGRSKTEITLTADDLLLYPDVLEMRVMYYDEKWNISSASSTIRLALTDA
ncbi:MAG: DUF4179 domain-containing protein [Clostridia bacterium]|nr:DUF4179 domain-containing protein [Clostridia bacterium]